jgi:hypothetical protein
VSALAVHLRIERLGFVDVLVDGKFLGEEPIELAAGPGTEISGPGAVRVEVLRRGESADAAAELRAAEAGLADTCIALGGPDPQVVRELHEEREGIEVALHETRVQMARVLGESTEEQLRTKIAEVDGLVAEIEAEFAAAGALGVDAAAAQRALLEATAEEIAAQSAVRDAELQVQRKQEEVRRAGTVADVTAARLSEVAQAETALTAELDIARAQVADDGLDRTAARARAEAAAATERLRVCEQEAEAADLAGFAASLSAAATAVEQARREEARGRDELSRAAGRLDTYQSDGRRERWERAEAELDAARHQEASTGARARAADLLHVTLTAHRDAQRARVQEPFQRAVEQLARLVFGTEVTVTVGDDLSIESRTADGVTVPFDSLSGGAQEQLGMLARLACAALVDTADGAPVIFDDALGHTDPGRLTAMADALVTAGRTAQVIVFSCVPGRFAALRGRTGVTEIDLGALTPPGA